MDKKDPAKEKEQNNRKLKIQRRPKQETENSSTKIVIPKHSIALFKQLNSLINVGNDKISESTASSPKIQKEPTFDPVRRLFLDSSAETPDYIKRFYERFNSEYTEQAKKAFYSSYQAEENKIDIEKSSFPKLPIPYQLESNISPALQEFKYDLELVTNENHKEKIKVTFQPGKGTFISEIPNPFDKEARESYFKQFSFNLDYRSGYAPIAIQAQQEQELNYKQHFIKK